MSKYFAFIMALTLVSGFYSSSIHAATVTLYCPSPQTIQVTRQPNCDPNTQPWCAYAYASEFIAKPDNAISNHQMVGQGAGTQFYNMTVATWTDQTFLCWYASNDSDQVIFSIDLAPYVNKCSFSQQQSVTECNGDNPQDCPLVCELRDNQLE